MKVELQSGDRIAIPAGCTATVNGNEVVIEKEQKEFKRGDVITSLKGETLLVDVHDYDSCLLRSFVHIGENKEFYQSPYSLWKESHEWRLATEEEEELLFDKMEEQGLRWNAEEKRVEKIRWRAKYNGVYFFITFNGKINSENDMYCALDNQRYNFGNYFRTREQAKKVAEVVKEALRKFHEEDK